MYPHVRLLAYALALSLFCQQTLASETGSRANAIRAYVQQGQYDLAITTTHTILAQTNLSDHERYELLSVLAETEEGIAEMRHYSHVEKALRAYKALHKEFPEKFGTGKFSWKVAWLNWKHGDFDRADIALQTILQDHPRMPEAKQAALLHARYLIKKKRFPAARTVLLVNFGLNPHVSAFEEAEGLVWLAVIDEAENRTKQAYKTMRKAYGNFPEIIDSSAMLDATYIRLLALYSDRQTLLSHISHFIKKHIASPEAQGVRLLQADMLTAQGKIQDAETIYGILADRHKDSSIGKKAFMRQLMLKLRGNHDKSTLNQAINTFSEMAATHQLSELETEAQLYQAQLLVRLGQKNPENLDHALAYYALVASSENIKFIASAREDGAMLLSERLDDLLKQKQWLSAVVLWKRYPQLRPAKAEKLSFGIAQAYIQLMDYSHAEEILKALYQPARHTVWGQRIMLEMARLWAAREDSDSVKKIMRWLAGQENTLYRQDMLLIAAKAQIKQGEAAASRQTLASVAPEDLTPELRHVYWHTNAMVNTSLHHWHAAADAWKRLAGLSQGDRKWHYVYAQADAKLQSRSYTQAEQILLQIPASARNRTWHYDLAICASNTGRWKTAQEHLIPLSTGDPDDNYTLRARLMLAEKHSDQIIGKQQ